MTIQKTITYPYGTHLFEGVIVAPRNISGKLPALLMAPNWLGITPEAIGLAERQAQQGYIVFLVDLYGQYVRPTDNQQASDAMLPLKNDRQELRSRMTKALAILIEQAEENHVDIKNIAVFGFCFGGCCALELARSGAAIKAAISFHGNLDTPEPSDAKQIKGSIMVLDGANDPLVPRIQLVDFANEMTAAAVDWQLISYGGAVHGYTDVLANEPGVKQYNAKITKRAFDAMNNLLDEVFFEC